MTSLMQYQVSPLMRQLFKEFDSCNAWDKKDMSAQFAEWVPTVDVHEAKDKYFVLMELPGVQPSDVDISAEGNVLTVKGHKAAKQSEEGHAWQRQECSYGRFYRQFTLPERVSTGDITAKYKNGILQLVLPKLPEHVEKSIKIEVEK